MDWNCLFVFKNTCHCKPVHVWFITASLFASMIFLWSLSITFYNTPMCIYDLTSTKGNVLGEHRRQRQDIAPSGMRLSVIRRSLTAQSQTGDKSVTIRKLERNISVLTQELRQLKHTLNVYEKLDKMVETDSSLKTFGSKLHQNVLLISLTHSGDIFLGEFFNRHPQVFYLFEPFHALSYFRRNRPPGVYESMLSSFLKGIVECDFAQFKYYTDFLSIQYRALMHRLSSRTLSAPPLCPEILTGRRHEYNIRQCVFLRPPTLDAICKLHSHTFIKTTQIVDLERLAQLSNADGNAEYPFRVVELVRDPRAIIHTSLLRSHENNSTQTLKDESQKICAQQKRNIKFARGARVTLSDRYIRVKYEDIMTDPFKTLSDLTVSLGLSMTSRDRSWVTDVLRDGFTWPAAATSEGMHSGLQVTEKLPQSAKTWQTGLTLGQIRLIENECSEVISWLGYTIFETESSKTSE